MNDSTSDSDFQRTHVGVVKLRMRPVASRPSSWSQAPAIRWLRRSTRPYAWTAVGVTLKRQ